MAVALVSTRLKYFFPPLDGTKPWLKVDIDPITKERPKNYEEREFDVQVENIRGKENSYTLDRNGFHFFNSPTTVRDFSDDQYIKEHYYPEQSELIKKLTGGSKVIFFDHTIRRNDDLPDTPQSRHPIFVVHVDQTPNAAITRVKRHAPPEQVSSLLKTRFLIINLWRPISNPVHELPLALCDWKSVDYRNGKGDGGEGDLVPTTLKYPTYDGDTYNVRFNPEHRWKYVKDMTLDEGWIFKSFDSIEDGLVSRLTPHTAFVDPSSRKDAAPRQSIELRALVFYE